MIKNILYIIISYFICFILFTPILIKYGKKKYLKDKGVRYKRIIDLNSNNNFLKKVFKYTVFVNANTKKKLENMNLLEIALNSFDNNEGNVKEYYYSFLEENKRYNDYVDEFNNIMAKDIIYKDDIVIGTALFKDINSFKEYELKKCKKLLKKFKYKFLLRVYATYDSPKGKKHWVKENTFDINDISSFPIILKQRTEYQKSKYYQREIMSDSLRYDVLKRDGYKCKICGASANDGAKLEVDHIIPISKGGKSVMDNLQTLCKSCNRGKSDKDY